MIELWNFDGQGGGVHNADLDYCIEILFERPMVHKNVSQREVKAFCLKYGFFACQQGAIYPVFSEEMTSVDYLKLQEDTEK